MEGLCSLKCHSHDSLTSGLFPFLLSFSPSLHSALLQFPFSVFLFSIHTKPSEGWSGPPGLLPLAEVGFQFLGCGPGAVCPGVRGEASQAWEGDGRHFWLRASSSVSRRLVRKGSKV